MTNEQEKKVNKIAMAAIKQITDLLPPPTPVEDFIAALEMVIDELAMTMDAAEEDLRKRH